VALREAAVAGVAVVVDVEAVDLAHALPTSQDITMKQPRLRILAAALALSLGCGFAIAADAPKAAASAPTSAKAKASKRVVFATPQEGFDALVAALRQHDTKALARLLGPGHERISDSGDSAADREAAEAFVADYDKKHTVQMEGDAKAFVTTGETDWPMPIPLVKGPDGWSFDADAGEEELLARRIGRNELDVIEVCLAFADMQREYAEADRNGDGRLEYAARLVSSPGKRDGLYWPAAAGEPPSPAGPRLAAANVQPRGGGKSTAKPFHGYYYRILTKQGAHAPGGARDYVVQGRLIGGVALVAWPASYLASGVKTFLCSLEGAVHEKDLGPETPAKVAKIMVYDPDPSWSPSK
jgi:hypothetical protein